LLIEHQIEHLNAKNGENIIQKITKIEKNKKVKAEKLVHL